MQAAAIIEPSREKEADIMRFVTDDETRRLYTEFLTRHPRCNFQQSPEWARVKSNWKNEIVLAEDASGHITGGLSILIRRIPLFGSLMYAARGPVCDPDDADALRQLMEGAELLAWKYRAMALRMEPDVEEDDQVFRAAMEKLGCKIHTPKDARDVIQPRQVFRLDLRGRTEAEVLAGFHPKLRYNIRLAERRGVVVREGTRRDLQTFSALMDETARRDGFLARPLSYFQRVWDELGPEHTTLLLAYYEGQPVAGAMPIFYGNKTWYAFGASATMHRNVMPCPLLQWEMIKLALARGDDVYDLRGVLEVTDEAAPNNGLYLFKRRFGGQLHRFIGEVYAPYRPVVYRLYRLAERAFMDTRDRLTTLRRHHRAPAAAPTPEPLALPSPAPAPAGQ